MYQKWAGNPGQCIALVDAKNRWIKKSTFLSDAVHGKIGHQLESIGIDIVDLQKLVNPQKKNQFYYEIVNELILPLSFFKIGIHFHNYPS